MKRIYIVWNAAKNEGYVTTEQEDAVFAASGTPPTATMIPTLGEAMRDCYGDEGLLEIQEIEVPE